MPNNRRQMTARYIELWDTLDLEPEEVDEVLKAMLRLEFPDEPPSVHDAAISAAIGQVARRISAQLSGILQAHGQK